MNIRTYQMLDEIVKVVCWKKPSNEKSDFNIHPTLKKDIGWKCWIRFLKARFKTIFIKVENLFSKFDFSSQIL